MEDLTAASPAGRRWFTALRVAVSCAAAVALATHLVVIWTGRFHAQDGPAHMFAASALRRLLDGTGGPLAAVYAPNFQMDPNWITYPLLSVWLRTNTLRVAELALVTLLVVGLAGALYYAVTSLGHAVGPVAIAGFALAVGWAVHTGLYNFTASVALLLVVIGYHIRVSHLMNAWRTVLLMLLLLALYFSHPLSLVVAYVALAVVGVVTTTADACAWRSRRLVGRRVTSLVVAVTPSAVLLALFLSDPGTVTPRAAPRDLRTSLSDLLLFRWPIQAVTPDDAVWATVLACATWVVVVVLLGRRVIQRDWSRWDALLVVPVVTGVGAIVVPDRLAGGTLVQPRLAIYMVLTLLLWVGAANVDVAAGRLLGLGLGVVGVVVLVGLSVVRAEPYRQMQAAIDEVAGAADVIPPDGLLLGAVSSRAPHLSPVVPMVHITDTVALQAGAVPVLTLDAGSGYGPIRYTERFDPGPALRAFPRNRTQGRDLTPEQFKNLARQYTRVTGVPFDYVMLVAYDLRPEEVDTFEATGFRLVRRTRPAGLVHVFEVTSRVAGSQDAMRRHDAPITHRDARPVDVLSRRDP